MKTRVRVELTAIREVEIVVEHDEDSDPTDLTRKEEQEAMAEAARSQASDWVVTQVDEIGPEQ